MAVDKKDTIAAIATGITESGIGVIRVSGEQAFSVADSIYKPVKKGKKISREKTHTIHYGNIVDEDEIVDEVLVMAMRAPHTYTGEDTIEINCHGGVLVMQKVLQTVIKHGARLAEPGEFTKRAFLNGKIDLTKAEAVIDVIHSKNEYALKSSVKQLRGAVSDVVKKVREAILYEIAFIESALDDPEHISLDGYKEKLENSVDKNKYLLDQLLRTAENGKIIREGLKTVIVGKPNAGKSSLLNVLLGEERAIVTDIAGTTRDTLEEQINLSGISLHVVDTAGIRDTSDVVEKIGVDKAKENVENADLIIYVVDASSPLDESDFEIINLIRERKAIVLLNKSDIESVVTREAIEKYLDQKVIPISAKEQTGIEELEDEIKGMFYKGEVSFNDEVIITNMRHKEILEQAVESLELVKRSIMDDMPEDFYSIDLMNAYEVLGNMIGESVGEDLVNEIFSKFCMGK